MRIHQKTALWELSNSVGTSLRGLIPLSVESLSISANSSTTKQLKGLAMMTQCL